jgi:hypothetical protein
MASPLTICRQTIPSPWLQPAGWWNPKWSVQIPDLHHRQLANPFPRGTLSVGSGQRVAWQGRLPHHYGPRFTLVTITGDVILLDGRLNIKPTHAVSILNTSKGYLVSFSYEDVLRSLKVSPAVLAEKARFGSWWISNKPSLDGSGNLA